MKEYLKYKNFIPVSFSEKKSKNEVSGNKRGIIGLILLNVIIFPININTLVDLNANKANEIAFESNEISISKIYKWLTLEDYSITSLLVNNNIGELTLKNKEEIKELEERGFKIIKIREEENEWSVILENDE